jgi:hypothetical protein
MFQQIFADLFSSKHVLAIVGLLLDLTGEFLLAVPMSTGIDETLKRLLRVRAETKREQARLMGATASFVEKQIDRLPPRSATVETPTPDIGITVTLHLTQRWPKLPRTSELLTSAIANRDVLVTAVLMGLTRPRKYESGIIRHSGLFLGGKL